MIILYDLIFILFSILYLPVFPFKGKAHKGFCQRMGFFSEGLRANLKAKKGKISEQEIEELDKKINYFKT